MEFSTKCRTKKLGIIYTILGSFCSLLNRVGEVFVCLVLNDASIHVGHYRQTVLN